ncbi:bzip transcription factor [Neofusicoccum parvum]|uniref:Bzip transcription factor n=2 Tax=Neofusicoccum parvum TaxID=310453 RepID=A0ACB5SCD9_9PEZI|nr:putative bzip transcription factor protein [Neofusicoccum parvum UCRNP2]GME33580.1 bzip transcription factor [Neofusicoccum parvum]GME60652.1 bzip transcription factor [Neofusicoccum parvum]
MMASKTLDIAPAPSPGVGDASSAHSPFAIPSPQSDGSGAGSPFDPTTPAHAASPPAGSAHPSHGSTPVALAPGPGTSPYITPAMNQGPCGNSYVIPPRPKPGRKPATDDPPSKRKQQNREAQRAFRQRKTQKMEETNRELQRALDERRQQSDAHQREVTHLNGVLTEERARSDGLQRKVDQLTSDNDSMRRQLDFVQDKLLKLERDMEYHRRLPPQNQLTPPAWRGDGDEQAAASAPPEARGDQGPTSAPPPQSAPITLPPLVRSEIAAPKDGCGKCADNGDCPCVDSLVDFSGTNRPARTVQDVEMRDMPTHDDEMEIDFTNFGKRPAATRPSAMEPPCKPGTCDACMKDPLQKRFCETLARERPVNRSFLSRDMSYASAKGDEDGPSSVKRQRLSAQNESIDCAEAYRRYFRSANLPVNEEHPAWMRELITLPPTRNDSIRLQQLKEATEAKHKRNMSAYELDMASVLNVLKKADTRHSTDGSSEQNSRHNSISISTTSNGGNSGNSEIGNDRNLGEPSVVNDESSG